MQHSIVPTLATIEIYNKQNIILHIFIASSNHKNSRAIDTSTGEIAHLIQTSSLAILSIPHLEAYIRSIAIPANNCII